MKKFSAPPKDSPFYAGYLAYRSLKLLGFLMYVFAVLYGLGLAISASSIDAQAGTAAVLVLLFMIATLAIMVGMGFTYRKAAVAIMRRRKWGAIVGIVLGGLSLGFSLLSALGTAARIATGQLPLDRPSTVVPIVINVVFVAAFGQMIYHCVQALRAINQWGEDRPRGFDVTPLGTPVVPASGTPQVSSATLPTSPAVPVPPPMVLPPRPRL